MRFILTDRHYSSPQPRSKTAEWWRWKLSSNLYISGLITFCHLVYRLADKVSILQLTPLVFQMILFSACCICGLIAGILNVQFVRALNKRPDKMQTIHLAAMTLACLGKNNNKDARRNTIWCDAIENNSCLFLFFIVMLLVSVQVFERD